MNWKAAVRPLTNAALVFLAMVLKSQNFSTPLGFPEITKHPHLMQERKKQAAGSLFEHMKTAAYHRDLSCVYHAGIHTTLI